MFIMGNAEAEETQKHFIQNKNTEAQRSELEICEYAL